MTSSISILSKIPNLTKELRILAPNLSFLDVLLDKNEAHLSKSNIIIADLDLLIPRIDSIKHAKWIQSTWAGVDKFLPYFTKDNFESTILSRFSGKHFGRLMSEYVIANIINHERNFFHVYENQKQKLWSQEGKIIEHRTIDELTIGILGIGQIGNYIGFVLNNMGAKIWGYGRRNNLPKTEEYKHYEKYCVKDTLPELLQSCDYVVNVLPNTYETTGLLNGNMLKNCSDKKTVFINIGRGSIINEKDLINALENKWLSAAILDVFNNEPLTIESPLWNLKQVFITPHVAGVSRPKDIAEQFVENYNMFINGEQLPTQLFLNNNY